MPPSAFIARLATARAGSRALSTQLAAAFAALLTLMLLVVALSAWHLRAVQLAADRVAREEWPRLLALHKLASHAQGHGAAMARLLTAPRAQREGIYPSLDAESAAMDRLTVEVKQRITEPDALVLVQALDVARHRYREVFADVGVWIESGDPARAAALFAADGQPALDRLVTLAGELAQAQQRAVADWQTRAADRVRVAETQLVLVTLLALAAAGLLAWRIGRGVARPMAHLADTARQLAAGDLRARVATSGLAGPREVERVGAALDAMAEALEERNARIEAIAFSDPVTGLPNRAGLLRRWRGSDEGGGIGQPGGSAAHGGNDGAPDTALLLDVARLAAVNDVLGPAAGDALLRELGSRLQASAAALEWDVAHLGAGTFAVVGRANPADVHAEVERVRAAVLEALSAPVPCADVTIDPQFRGGWSQQAADASSAADPARLLREAEEALSDAKRLRVELHRFEHIDPQQRRRQIVLLGSLKEAAIHGGLQMWLQPKVALAPPGDVGVRASCHGFEALVRWQHPTWGMVSPAEFVPFAEAAGMVGVITRCMVDQALHFLAQPAVQALAVPVSVNVSTADLLDDSFVDWLCERAQRTGAPLGRLMLEITEGRLMDDAGRALPRMHALREAGVRWSIDDFGTGYSSLAYLQRLPVSELKVDRSFVDQVDRSPARIALLNSIVQLGHGLGLQVTAEGIERPEEWAVLQQAGCHLGQGWLFARPMPPAAALKWAADRDAAKHDALTA
ncbi:MAG: EAL domain-containing protein [Burkholderiaceae bacterium]|nr:EAL domain-containing protein [Burkholderiaceae bacterium]MCU0963485.1 EAL domain-containing protein [Burkholderiaceae bacterium]